LAFLDLPDHLDHQDYLVTTVPVVEQVGMDHQDPQEMTVHRAQKDHEEYEDHPDLQDLRMVTVPALLYIWNVQFPTPARRNVHRTMYNAVPTILAVMARCVALMDVIWLVWFQWRVRRKVRGVHKQDHHLDQSDQLVQ
jgi:hypothetical protein